MNIVSKIAKQIGEGTYRKVESRIRSCFDDEI